MSVDPLFLQPFFNFWTSYIQRADEATKTMLENFDGNADPGALRRQWLDAVSKNTDAYLRSPFFVQMLKNHIDTLIETKRRANDLSKGVAHGAGFSDCDVPGLLERLSGVEETVLSKLERIEQRLKAIEDKLSQPDEFE